MNAIRNLTAEYIEIKPDANEDTDNTGSVNEKFPSTIKYEAEKINPFSFIRRHTQIKNKSCATLHAHKNQIS